jgi:hypothetical protein
MGMLDVGDIPPVSSASDRCTERSTFRWDRHGDQAELAFRAWGLHTESAACEDDRGAARSRPGCDTTRFDM